MAGRTMLFIGGGWHVESSYNKLTRELQAAGFQVHVLSHPSMNGSRPPNGGSDAFLRRPMGTNALNGLGLESRKNERLIGGVSDLVYLTAVANAEGKTQMDLVTQMGHAELVPLAFDFAEDMSVVSRDPKMLIVGETNLPEAEVAEYIATLQRWNGQTMYQPLTTPKSAWREIPVTYVYCTKDMTIPFDYQKWYVNEMKKSGVAVQTVALETGHAPHLTATKELVDILAKVARGESLEDNIQQVGQVNSKDDVKGAILNVGGGSKE